MTDEMNISEQSDTQKPEKADKFKELFEGRTYIYSIGRRKTATARVRLYTEGKGRMFVNKKEFRGYFPYFEHQKLVTQPLDALKEKNNFDVSVIVTGGGVKAQAESVRHGLARALVEYRVEWKSAFRKLGLMTRDAREKERKKPGLKKARRAPQWAKR